MVVNDDILAHYGVKGMRWGVRKDRKGKGRKSSAQKPPSEKPKITEEDISILKKAYPNGVDLASVKAKYGPQGGKKIELSDKQKAILKKAAIGAGVVGVGYLGAKGLQELGIQQLPKETRPFFRDQVNFLNSRKMSDYAHMEDISLPKGAMLRRVSMSRELDIRNNGFYACHSPADVERYKAVLPVFWKMWGGDPSKGGYVVNIKAGKGLKAASPNNAYSAYKDWVKTNGGGLKAREKDFFAFANSWANHGDFPDPKTKSFFDHLAKKGYNAVVDVNDAGALSEAPLRMFSSDGFKVSSNSRLTANKISEARKTLQRIEHAIMTNAENVLAHYGVKGMRWGVRRTPSQLSAARASRSIRKDAAKDAKEFARAKAFYGDGAGTRRKQIKQTVEAKSNRSSSYKKAFEESLTKETERQDTHVSKAQGERKRKDFVTKNKQRAGALARNRTGQMGTQAAYVALAAAGAAYLKSPSGQAKIRSVANKVQNSKAHKQGADYLSDYFARNS